MSETPKNDKFFAVRGGIDPVYLTGKVKWPRLNTLDNYGKWSIVIYPDQESMTKVNKLISDGIKNKLRKDDDGYCITFSRPPTLNTKYKMVSLEKPPVMRTDGTIIPNDIMIGNGSTCTIKLETYGGKSPTGFGTYKAARLGAVRVDELVEYKKESFPEPEKVKLATGLQEQPIKPFTPF